MNISRRLLITNHICIFRCVELAPHLLEPQNFSCCHLSQIILVYTSMHYCNAIATLLQHYCNTIATLLLHFCNTIASLLQHYCNTTIATLLLQHYYCNTIATLFIVYTFVQIHDAPWLLNHI